MNGSEAAVNTRTRCDVPGRGGQKGAGRMCSGGFASQGTHALFTQRQRRPGPEETHRAGSTKAGQDGGV